MCRFPSNAQFTEEVFQQSSLDPSLVFPAAVLKHLLIVWTPPAAAARVVHGSG